MPGGGGVFEPHVYMCLLITHTVELRRTQKKCVERCACVTTAYTRLTLLPFTYVCVCVKRDVCLAKADVETGELVCNVPTIAAMNSIAWHPSCHVLACAGDEKDRQSGRDTGNVHLVSISNIPE